MAHLKLRILRTFHQINHANLSKNTSEILCKSFYKITVISYHSIKRPSKQASSRCPKLQTGKLRALSLACLLITNSAIKTGADSNGGSWIVQSD